MALELKQGHNQAAYLVKDKNWAQYDEIIDLIVKSPYYTAFTIDPPIHVGTLREFWANAVETVVNDKVVSIKFTVQNKTMAITPEILGIKLGLNDKDAPEHFKSGDVQSTMTACDYQGDLSHTTIYKRYFDSQYKFLFHQINMCFSPKTGSVDQMPFGLQQVFHSIVNKTPLKISNYFFNEIVLHLQKEDNKKFLLYPRFLMHCILDEVDKELLVGPIEKLRPLTSQVFSRHNTQAFRPDDVQGKQKPVPLEPTSSSPKSKKPTKKRKLTKPSQPEKKAPQEAEMPEDVNVQSALEQGTTETSSQLDAPSHSPKRAKKTSEPSLKTYIKKRSKKDYSKTAEPEITKKCSKNL